VLTFSCDWCGRCREEGERWMLGFAAERVGASGVQREFSETTAWSEKAAEHPLAVHFCSEAHKMRYMTALFSPRRQRAVAEATMGKRRLSARGPIEKSSSVGTISLGGSLGAVATGREPARKLAPQKRLARRPKTVETNFNDSDEIRSRGLSVRLRVNPHEQDEYWSGS